jgi:hypothetical protein
MSCANQSTDVARGPTTPDHPSPSHVEYCVLVLKWYYVRVKPPCQLPCPHPSVEITLILHPR